MYPTFVFYHWVGPCIHQLRYLKIIVRINREVVRAETNFIEKIVIVKILEKVYRKFQNESCHVNNYTQNIFVHI